MSPGVGGRSFCHICEHSTKQKQQAAEHSPRKLRQRSIPARAGPGAHSVHSFMLQLQLMHHKGCQPLPLHDNFLQSQSCHCLPSMPAASCLIHRVLGRLAALECMVALQPPSCKQDTHSSMGSGSSSSKSSMVPPAPLYTVGFDCETSVEPNRVTKFTRKITHKITHEVTHKMTDTIEFTIMA